VAKMKAKRFYSYLLGDVKNWDYDDTVHYGDIAKKNNSSFEFLKRK
jgi:hypothetical protein